MNRIKRFFTMTLALLLICGMFSGCAGGKAVYSVTVTDALGEPYTTGVVVQFLSGGEQVALQVLNEQGVAEKKLPRADYTVELVFTGDAEDYYYEKDGLTLSATDTKLTVTLAYSSAGEPVSLYAAGEEHNAYTVNAGSTHVDLTAGRNYFLFSPTVAGTYEFSVSNNNAIIGYYGAPHFVQENSAAEVVDNKFTISVSASMIGTNGTGTTVIVIGLDSDAASDSMLNVKRTGDPERTLEDEPWMIYQKTVALSEYKLPEGAVLKDFDITASTNTYNLVLNENDGYYHLNSKDGPLVLLWLGEKTKYLESFEKILESSGVSKYFFDEDGEFVKKESYSECLLEYIEYMDEDKGVYPLTEDLKYILQQRGEYSGWWDPDANLYLFKDSDGNNLPGINNDIAWLFMCCYIEAN